jgi:uncharacterized OsmC-like protein
MSSATAINGVDVVALKDTIEAVRNERALGEVTFAVDGSWDGGFRLKAETGTMIQGGVPDASRSGMFRMESDEPAALLGSDTATSPGEHLLQALAGCYTVTLAANAAARGIELDGYRLHLEADFDLSGFLGIDPATTPGAQGIRATLELEAASATREELEELVALVEARSPIRDTLARAVEVTTRLV